MNYTYNDRILIQIGHTQLNGGLVIPEKAKGIVLFTNGIGSGRMSPSSQNVAISLNKALYGTLLFDLLTEEEDKDYFNRFDIELLTSRLISATHWLSEIPTANRYPIGYFGTGVSAAAVLDAAAILPNIKAIVCRSGRPDLTVMPLPEMTVPIMLIAGSLDYDVLKINEEAMNSLACPKKLEVVPGASHLFQEPCVMNKASMLAIAWFNKYLHPLLHESAVTEMNTIIK